ncbi:hypothetical protein TIFTF001_007954 [Ficus carica]|uniref:Uncharacterized protein n=1 Tax=Ficus carica TaxID=3494 RepID=A0AA88CXK1_FICCA|nr:hypothetical protein TIFTF001_007954 [Ficus carica]
MKIGYGASIVVGFLMAVAMFGMDLVPNDGGLLVEVVVLASDADGGSACFTFCCLKAFDRLCRFSPKASLQL